MNDTPEHIYKKQFEITFEQPLKERLENIFEMTELARNIIQNRIKSQNPGISDIDLKIKLFKIFYKTDFDKQTFDSIIDDMQKYYAHKESSNR
ncbi:MAG: hypothetical protein L3J74_01110 [Bacteroidales bacterium]|nr:hypothetical protein [Bacteroidales bacterium]